MSEREIYLTPEGAQQLRAELAELRGPRREALAGRLRHAVQQGDLSENADYIAAKEEQAFLEGRIQELENILREAIIVEAGGSRTEVTIGATVVVAVDGGGTETYQLVGVKEANPRQGKISHESPIGLALMGKRVGDVAMAHTPGGIIEMRVVEIR
ncbi:MAG: transcription elongation factor GreA [Chloroflexota bacterium]